MDKINIALDGPAGAGKSTVARLVAKELGYVYIDTGAMYRAITWKALFNGLTPDNTDEISRMAIETVVSLQPGAHGQTVYVDGLDVTDQIRDRDVNQQVSQISAIPEVRDTMTKRQQELAINKGVVMDGRDIGTNVLPEAEIKVFLTASSRVRAQRRYNELRDPDLTLDELEQEIIRRDRLDRNREHAPLCQAEDAILVDSTEMSQDEVVRTILQLCRNLKEWR